MKYKHFKQALLFKVDSVVVINFVSKVSSEMTSDFICWGIIVALKILISLKRIYTFLKENCYICRQKHKI